LGKNVGEFTPLSPLSLLWARGAYVYPKRVAIIHGEIKLTLGRVYTRCRAACVRLCRKWAVSVRGHGAAMLPIIFRRCYEGAFRRVAERAVLNTLNTRLDADAIAFHARSGEAKVLLTDREFSATIAKADAGEESSRW
jgi:fatty-acyl-CoA synthase